MPVNEYKVLYKLCTCVHNRLDMPLIIIVLLIILRDLQNMGHAAKVMFCFAGRSQQGKYFSLLAVPIRTTKRYPENEWENFILSYDNMCNLCKLRGAKASLPSPKPYDLLCLEITMVIDGLHLRNHKNKLCHTLYLPGPLKSKYPELNTMVAEQTFAWAARYKKILSTMPMRRFPFYYHRTVVHRNNYTSDCRKEKKNPLLPKTGSIS